MTRKHKRQRRAVVPPAWTVAGLAEALGCDRALLYAAKRAGELGPFWRVGNRKYVLTESVIAWLKSQRVAS